MRRIQRFFNTSLLRHFFNIMDSLDYHNLARRISALERAQTQRDTELSEIRAIAAALTRLRDAAQEAAGTPRVSV